MPVAAPSPVATEVVPLHRPSLSRVSLGAAGLLVLALVGGCAATPEAARSTGVVPTTSAASASVAGSATSSATPRPSAAPPAARDPETPEGDPVRVVVTSLGGEELVDARLIPAGLDDDGILAPPAGVAGWYDEKGWPRPGFPGASILAGHINTRMTGPDTFARLPEVRPGARVTVTYDSGDDVAFVVVRSKAVPKEETPRDDSIWDAGNPRPLLRLITCDPTTPVKGGHYVGNWVLWANAAPATT